MKKLGAVFGQKFGWERANFFATDGAIQEMIGHSEDLTGLNVWKENVKMFVKMLVCWI